MPITKPTPQTYSISRYEQTGDNLFIRLESTNNPVYLEHFFTPDEQNDIEGIIEGLVAQLEVLDDDYITPTPMISKMDEVPNLSIKTENIAIAKTSFLAEKAKLEAPIEEVNNLDIKQ